MSLESTFQRRPQLGSSSTPFRDMEPEERLALRRQEREVKKERERTLAFFVNAKTALDEMVERNSGDDVMRAGVVDGVVSELSKRLRADKELHLLRNSTVCRAVEAVVRANTNLLHAKTILYHLMGKVAVTACSPTASFVFEALISNMWKCLTCQDGATDLSGDGTMGADAYASEVDPNGGSGSHAGSGLPNVYTLFQQVNEELLEKMDDIISIAAASRSLRTWISITSAAPPLQRTSSAAANMPPPPFYSFLVQVVPAFVASVERVFMPQDTDKPRRADAWRTACTTTHTAVIIQTFLSCNPDTAPEVDVGIRQRLLGFRLVNSEGEKVPLLHALMLDDLGAHVFQGFLKSPAPSAALEAATEFLHQQTSAAEQLVRKVERGAAKRQKQPQSDAVDTTAAAAAEKWWEACDVQCPKAFQTSWDVALQMFLPDVKDILESEKVRVASFLLQDFATYAPSCLHLALFWEKFLKSNVTACMDTPALTAVLTRFARKCVVVDHRAKNSSTTTNNNSSKSPSVSSGIQELIAKDVAAGASYFDVPISFRKEVLSVIVTAIRLRQPKGAPHALLVDQCLGEHLSCELLQTLLAFGVDASLMLMHAFDKLTIESLGLIAMHPQGSYALQQWLQNAAAQPPSTTPPHSSGNSTSSAPSSAPIDLPMLRRMARRLESHIVSLAKNKHGCHVVEVLYDVAPIDVKESLVKLMVPVLQERKEQSAGRGVKRPREEDAVEGGAATEAEVPPPQDGTSDFYLWKVMQRLCVEQYLYRNEEWKQQVVHAAHVQRMMRRILAMEASAA